MSADLPCPLCGGLPSGRNVKFCTNLECELASEHFSADAWRMVAALRKPLTPDEADALLDAFDDECPAGTPHNTACARGKIRDALTGKR